MKKIYKNIFALTDNGAENLAKATYFSFLVYCINMVPAIISLSIIKNLLTGYLNNRWIYAGISIVILILMYFLLTAEYTSLYNATYKESADLRIQITESLVKLPLSYFSKHNLSDISQTIMTDVEGIEHAMSHSIPKFVAFAIFFPLISILMLIGNIKLGLAVIIPNILNFMVIPLSKKIQLKWHNKYYQVLRINSEAFQEAIELQQEIKSFNLLEKIKKELYKKMEESEKIHFKEEFSLFIIMVFTSLFGFVSLGIVILTGIYMILAGESNIVYFIGYLLAAIKIKDGIDSSKESIAEVFYILPKIAKIKSIKTTKIQTGKNHNFKSFNIEFKNVSFSYKEGTPVLKDLSFTANQGEITALVGVSGCGKTSVLRLISRLYDYDKGKILIDNKNIKDISTKSLFNNISIVFQDVLLFNTSIMENIRIGRKDATDEEVKRAAEFANCTDFINKLEQGYDTLIGENGAKLSGGERQRLSIARAFLKNSPILILDEISANLDINNEKKIQQSLNKLIENKTVIIISHRLKSIENVDKIVVINDGKVEAAGRHKDIIEKSKVYKNLIEKSKAIEEFIY